MRPTPRCLLLAGVSSASEMKSDMRYSKLLVLLLCCCYCFFSSLMTFVNKILLSSLHFQFPFLLLLFQNVFSFSLLGITSYIHIVTLQSIDALTAARWLPVNALFVLYVVTGTFSVQLLSVPMVTIFKNLQTILTAFGDTLLFGQKMSFETLISILLMLFGSVVAGIYDLEWNTEGYCWMAINVVVGACYVVRGLYMRKAITSTGLGQLESTYYNNALSIPFLVPCVYFYNEIPRLILSKTWQLDSYFVWIFLLSGVSAFALSVTSVWVVHVTSPTTYSMVGALNKIPQTLAGIALFKTPLTRIGGASILIGLFGGIVFSYSKNKEMGQARTKPFGRRFFDESIEKEKY